MKNYFSSVIKETHEQKVLIIDDEPLLLDLLTHVLGRIGYQVAQASSGLTALNKLRDESFDVIFADIRLPDIDGTEFYQKVKEQSYDLAKRIIFVTGDVANRETMSFIGNTGNLYLEKPFGINRVKEILDKLFRQE